MLRYFPFTGTFDLKMGTSPVQADAIVEIDEYYASQVLYKRNLLEADHTYYYKAGPATEEAQWEVLKKIMDSLVSAHPEHYVLQQNGKQWIWENKILQEKHAFVIGSAESLPQEPLDWVGRQVQEDLIILNPSGMLVAGQLCFPAGWSLEEKVGKQFLEIHDPLPAVMLPMIQTADKLLGRIPVDRPLQRTNWGMRVCDQLDLSSRHTSYYKNLLEHISSAMTDVSAGDMIFLRVERQTLSRLPASGYILFTIHTYLNTLAEVAEDKNRVDKLLSFLTTVPVAVLDYKQITPFVDSLMAYLQRMRNH